MSDALVSIVLPTYNRGHLLPHAIRSVLCQTHARLELIIVDDNSNDATPEVVRSFQDARIRYVRNERNLKLPGALNRGFALAEGRFLTWTSDDNLYAPEAIARMVAALEEATCDFVFADYFDFARHDERTGEPLRPRRIRLPDQLKLDERNSVGACFLYTRAVCEAVGAYDTDLFLVEDYDYFIRVAQAGFRIRHLPEALYYFSRHDDSLFCARYAEVKSADVLVRYKNGLLDKRRAASACVDLLMRDPDGLRNPLLKSLHRRLRRLSYRLTSGYMRFLRRYVAWKIGPPVVRVLDQFSARAIDFRQA
ncbi:MAG TPA: glycosyltransferase, partial [Burkholderiales bacterium]|nr:glycosyltransferase [Burkholderiales bacterium]